MLKKFFAGTLVCTLILSSATFAFADSKGKGSSDKIEVKKEKNISKEENSVEAETVAEEEITNEDIAVVDEENEDSDVGKPWKILRDKLEQEKDELEVQKNEIEAQKDELEKQYEEALNGENTESAEELKEQIEKLKEEMQGLKQDMTAVKVKRKEAIRNKYTEAELARIQEAKEELLEADGDIKVLYVDSILSKKTDMKFDTPPVIKGSRTLVPIRAIVEGFGAEVQWSEETREVTILKGDIEILLPLDNNEVYVNGEKVELDTKAEIMNSRTYVPLRFVAETLRLKVDWDEETETIELEEDIEEEAANDEIVIEDIEIIVEDIEGENADESFNEEINQEDTEEIIVEDVSDEATEE